MIVRSVLAQGIEIHIAFGTIEHFVTFRFFFFFFFLNVTGYFRFFILWVRSIREFVSFSLWRFFGIWFSRHKIALGKRIEFTRRVLRIVLTTGIGIQRIWWNRTFGIFLILIIVILQYTYRTCKNLDIMRPKFGINLTYLQDYFLSRMKFSNVFFNFGDFNITNCTKISFDVVFVFIIFKISKNVLVMRELFDILYVHGTLFTESEIQINTRTREFRIILKWNVHNVVDIFRITRLFISNTSKEMNYLPLTEIFFHRHQHHIDLNV